MSHLQIHDDHGTGRNGRAPPSLAAQRMEGSYPWSQQEGDDNDDDDASESGHSWTFELFHDGSDDDDRSGALSMDAAASSSSPEFEDDDAVALPDGLVPPPRPAATPAARSKRQRSGGGGGPSQAAAAATGRGTAAAAAAAAATTSRDDDFTRTLTAQSLSFPTVLGWLRDSRVQLGGPRPESVRGVEHVEGRLYKEAPGHPRRREGWDNWISKGGPRGTAIEAVGEGLWMKRAYGALTVLDHAGGEIRKLRYHQYSLHDSDPRLAAAASRGGGGGAAGESPQQQANGARKPSPSRRRKKKGSPPIQQQQQQQQQRYGKVYHIVAQTGTGALRASTAGERVHVDSVMVVRKGRTDDKWMEFEGHDGTQMGFIGASRDGTGVALQSTSGKIRSCILIIIPGLPLRNKVTLT